MNRKIILTLVATNLLLVVAVIVLMLQMERNLLPRESGQIICGTTDVIIDYGAYSPKGEKIFNANCRRCHSMGKGNSPAPDLAMVSGRIPKGNWIDGFIRDERQLFLKSDPTAIHLNHIFKIEHENLPEFEHYFPMDDEQMRLLKEYLLVR